MRRAYRRINYILGQNAVHNTPIAQKAVATRYIETRKFRVPRMLPCGILVIGCPSAEPPYENSEHFTNSQDNSSLNSVPCRLNVSSPGRPSASLRGRRLHEDPDLQQLGARREPVHNRCQCRYDLPQLSSDLYEHGGRT